MNILLAFAPFLIFALMDWFDFRCRDGGFGEVLNAERSHKNRHLDDDHRHLRRR